jgi:hypothetical protein
MSRLVAVCSAVLVFAATVTAAAPRAQELQAPAPAPELKKLEPMVGNWSGKGTMTEPSEPTPTVTSWEGSGTYSWAMDGHFLRGDFSIAFQGHELPIVMRSYLGWDRENKRYVHLSVNSAGEVALDQFDLQPDGTMVQLAVKQHPGMRFAQRSVFKVAGDTMTHTVDLLMPAGASLAMVDGKFARGGKGFAGDFEAKAFMGMTPHEALARLQRSAGAYDVAGTMVMAPGQAPMKITGTDTFKTVFGGTVFFGTTVGAAEGMPGRYSAEVFWGHDAARDCLVGVYVSNMGEVMQMDSRWTQDGRLITTSDSLFMGQPTVQRMLMEFDADGAAKSASSHSIAGTEAPFESFKATYTKKK